jgi:hypothetical protein
MSAAIRESDFGGLRSFSSKNVGGRMELQCLGCCAWKRRHNVFGGGQQLQQLRDYRIGSKCNEANGQPLQRWNQIVEADSGRYNVESRMKSLRCSNQIRSQRKSVMQGHPDSVAGQIYLPRREERRD